MVAGTWVPRRSTVRGSVVLARGAGAGVGGGGGVWGGVGGGGGVGMGGGGRERLEVGERAPEVMVPTGVLLWRRVMPWRAARGPSMKRPTSFWVGPPCSTIF